MSQPKVFITRPGATLGIVGFGRIGQAVARRAKGFEMRILYTSQHPGDAELEQSLGVEFVIAVANLS